MFDVTMSRLAPLYLYRLRMLAGGARLYKSEAVMKRLEKDRLVEPTGREDPDGQRIEYAITEAGRDALRCSEGDVPKA